MLNMRIESMTICSFIDYNYINYNKETLFVIPSTTNDCMSKLSKHRKYIEVKIDLK